MPLELILNIKVCLFLVYYQSHFLGFYSVLIRLINTFFGNHFIKRNDAKDVFVSIAVVLVSLEDLILGSNS